MGNLRKIIHIDMDAFYASVEQRDTPAYQGRPLVVGGRPEQRGVVAAASYEARRFGIHAAMPSRTAQQCCPQVIFVKPRFDVYRQVSRQIHGIFRRYSDLIEPLALDEAYLDVTANKRHLPSAQATAQAIKRAIYQETGLTASAGVAMNKFLAKIASGHQKPDGLTLITPGQALAFVATLAIERFHGIGQVTATKMHGLGIYTGADLQQWSEAELVRHFGKVGRWYYQLARAADPRPVNPSRVRKSIGVERSFARDLETLAQLQQALAPLAEQVASRLKQRQRCGYTLTLKLKYADYRQITRSYTRSTPFETSAEIHAQATQLLIAHWQQQHRVRLLGIAIANLQPVSPYTQLSLDLTLETTSQVLSGQSSG
ncbi:DNA polymerase IV [Halomicronema hongdechloris C2206]|uniref:DNA polymerase IV n=1 Tax=Halomicronema hongdechloris C2206 TaxID=1641165 RepID=A0A1Z3HPL9_9CYAN|nr:DNA polymerase IV [Halomicronema hongdechloris]ASC72245.1 DNA polymerase IV [Halomicronema hongdechloris C2206]